MLRGVIWRSLLALLCASPLVVADEVRNQRTDYTAYTRPRGRVAAGPLKLELGLIDEVTVGTYVPPWFAFPALGAPVPNGYVKLRSWWPGPAALAVRGGALFIDGTAIAELADESASASVLALMGELDLSLRLSARLSLSAGLDYTHLAALGDAQQAATSLEGASTADTYNARLFAEWRLTRVFSLSLLLRYLIYQSPLEADTNLRGLALDVDGDLSAESSRARKRAAVVPGVAFDWEHWELALGVGYGVFALPALGIPTARAYPVVDLAFAYRFDLYD